MSIEHLRVVAEETDRQKLFENVDRITSELVELVSSFSQEEINKPASEGSWTAAKVADHVRKSNNGIAQSLQMKGRVGERKGDERVNDLKIVFLDFDKKLKSPEFILPGQETYDREALIGRLKRSVERIKEERISANLSEIIDLAVLGTISKLELLHFVIYHTQRHINQLKNISKTIKTKTNVTDQSLSQLSGNNGRSI